MAKLKYKVGDMVYTYLNPTVKRRISHTRQNDPGYPNVYKLALFDREGFSYSSHWVNEESISKRKLR
jgi:hypothetical protein